jgi:DNA-binding NtrC family response regulator
MKLGAYEFLRKEALPYDLRNVVEHALKAGDEVKAQHDLPIGPEGAIDLGDQAMIGRSSAMQEVFKLIGRVSRGDAVVTITGESGCGKEIVAKAIHRFSPRAKKEFLAINCAAIPENLLESELFGHEKGSFTGAQTQRMGRFEQCDGGSLFLDEIGDMPMQLQSKILRVLQEGEYCRVGGNQTLKADVRIIAATNRNLEKEVEQGTFREDLFYRLNVVRIHIPPLRERPDDIRLLATFFLQRLAKKRGNLRLRIAEDTYKLLESYNWPGNVRELENTIQRACALANADVLLPRDIPLGAATPNAKDEPDAPMVMGGNIWAELLEQAAEAEIPPLAFVQRELARHVLSVNADDAATAAKVLGIKAPALKKLLE